MNKKNRLNDFRTTRSKLPPESFALGPKEPDPTPRDLIKKETWKSIISLPDDVSLRTSENHGVELRVMDELWASWIESVGEDQDAISYTMLDASDEFQACLFNSLCGFYRVAASCLRSALELNTIGAYFQLVSSPSKFLEWKEGKLPMYFGKVCDLLLRHFKTNPIHNSLESQTAFSIFEQKSPGDSGGWARRLYSELSAFAHSRPQHSSVVMWDGSNGPIYVPSSFETIYAHYLDTMSLGYVLVKLARPTFKLPKAVKHIFQSSKILRGKVAIYSFQIPLEKFLRV